MFTTQIFGSAIDGQILEFGTSGKLYNSNLVMYDRTSESLWSQAMEGIVGRYAGTKLEKSSLIYYTVENGRSCIPMQRYYHLIQDLVDHTVQIHMATNTSPSIYFPVANHDSRLEMVIALEYNGVYRVYQL